MKDLWEHTKYEEKLAQLRAKWSKAKKEGDTTMMGIYERQARALEIANK